MIPPAISATRGVGASAWRPRHHLPAGLDVGELLRGEWVGYAEWVVGAVVWQQHARHVGPDVMVPLSYDFATAHVPERAYRPMRKALLAAGVLDCDGVYHFDRRGLVPGKCLCYRLGTGLRGQPLVARPITHPELLRKMNAQHQAERSAIGDPVHVRLRAWHDRVAVVADAPVGLHVLLDRMIDGERRFTVCDQGRVHTNVCNLPRWCRQYVRLDGQEVVSVDVATSQPLLLGLVVTGRARVPKGGGRGSRPSRAANPGRPIIPHFL